MPDDKDKQDPTQRNGGTEHNDIDVTEETRQWEGLDKEISAQQASTDEGTEPGNPMNGSDSGHRKKRSSKQRRNRRIIIWSSVGVVVLALAGVAYARLNKPGDTTFKDPAPAVAVTPPAEKHRKTILLVGTDTRPGETGGLTDVLILASIDYKHKRLELLSIPRDTMVTLPDKSIGKINSAYDIGGISLTDSLIESITGIDAPNYALTHFGGLVDIINTVGGIWVNVPEPMHYDTGDKQYGIIDLNPGYQKLTGQQALGFVRFREDALGDIGRTQRQQAFLKALEKALLKPSNIVKLPTLLSEFSGTVDSNLSTAQEMGLASQAKTFKRFKMITMTLPGAFYNPDTPGHPSYWLVNSNEAQWVAHQFFYNGIVQPNIIQTVDQTQNWTKPLPNQNTPSNNQVQASGSSNNGG